MAIVPPILHKEIKRLVTGAKSAGARVYTFAESKHVTAVYIEYQGRLMYVEADGTGLRFSNCHRFIETKALADIWHGLVGLCPKTTFEKYKANKLQYLKFIEL